MFKKRIIIVNVVLLILEIVAFVLAPKGFKFYQRLARDSRKETVCFYVPIRVKILINYI